MAILKNLEADVKLIELDIHCMMRNCMSKLAEPYNVWEKHEEDEEDEESVEEEET